ncbi:MAG TPA: response regulator [Chthonomonadaceae bacterium]|nr:response regulator [Chthonomonadaceae bacterium]
MTPVSDQECLSPARLPAADISAAKSLRRKAIFVFAANALLLAWLALKPASHALIVAVDNIAGALGPLLAAFWGLLPVRRRQGEASPSARPGRTRQRWAATWLGLGVLAFALGEVIWTYYELILGRKTPFPSWADAGYLSAYPLLLIGILLLPRRALPLAARGRVVLDSLMTMTALVTFSWYFLLGPTILQGSETLLGKILGAGYPIGDLILLFCLLVLLTHAEEVASRRVLCTLSMGLVSIVLVDVVFGYQTLHNTYATGTWMDVGWSFGYMLIGLAAGEVRLRAVAAESDSGAAASVPAAAETQGGPERLPALWRSLLPYALAPAVGGLLLYTRYAPNDNPLEPGLYVGSALLIGLVLLRQVMALLENRHLYQSLRGAYNRLEATSRSVQEYARAQEMLNTALEDSAQELALANERMEAACQRFAALFEGLPVACFTLDAQGRIQEWNRAFEALYGLSAAQILHKTLPETIWRLGGWQQGRERIARVLAGEALEGLEQTTRRADGTACRVLVSTFPLRGPDGTILGAISVHVDITARKRAEEALARTAQELERRNTELAEAHEAALAAARLKAEFLANMSHEIRTPMNGVLGMTELLLSTPLTATQQMYARTLQQSAEALLTIINDVLDLSKIEAGKLTIEQVEFSLRDLLEEVALLLAPQAHEKCLEFCCAPPPQARLSGDPAERVLGDPVRLRQVLINLLGNAIKFTEPGGEVVLGAELLWEDQTHARWRLSVRDTGIGIAPDRQEAIFESFTQADGSTTRRYGGTGLGLAICRQLMRLMDGEIGLTSAVGQGSTFWAELTLEKQAQATQDILLPSHQLAGQRVLIADDNPTVRRLLREQLAAWGCLPFEAASGAQAWETLQRMAAEGQRCSLALVDWQLPDGAGIEIALRLQESRLLTETPVILLRPLSASGACAESPDSAFATCLNKPIRAGELFQGLLQALHGAGPADVGSTTRPGQEGRQAVSPPVVGARAPRLLMAEDNRINQLVALEMLKQCGFAEDQVTMVSNGRQALEALEAASYDLILMDVQMPEMDGFEATQAIRSREQELGKPPVPILAMTAHAMAGDRERCQAAGMDDYLSKPIHTPTLREMLSRWLSHSALPEPPSWQKAA